MNALRDLTLTAVAFRFLLAFVFGGTIGLERGWRQQAAGLRTHMLVCIGAASTMLVNEYTFLYYGAGDPQRLSAQVISGIGFLGAGTILVTRRNQIKGLTTAASLWATACMGLAIGSGFYECAIIMYSLLIIVLIIVNRFDSKYLKISTDATIFIEIRRDVSLGIVLHEIRELGWYVRDMKEFRSSNASILALKLDLTSDKASKADMEALEILRTLDGVLCMQEL